MKSKQAELPFDRPGELPLFGPSTAPEPFEVPEFPLEGEPALTPEPEPASERWTRLLWLLERADHPAPARYLVRGGRDYLDRLEGRDVARVEAQARAQTARPLEQELFNPRREIINRYSTSQDQRDEATEELTNDDMASHLAGLHDEMQERIDRLPEGESKRDAIATRDQARADLEELLLFGGAAESDS